MTCYQCFGMVYLLIVTLTAGARTAHGQASATTSDREYWTDQNGLRWARHDNGGDVSWEEATRYCRDLRTGGFSDWRLANTSELETISDSTANATGLLGNGEELTTWHVKGALYLTGYVWSNFLRSTHNGNAFYFDFRGGWADDRPVLKSSGMRALCVEGGSGNLFSWNDAWTHESDIEVLHLTVKPN